MAPEACQLTSSDRFTWLRHLAVLDSEYEAQFDEVVRMAAEVCHTPMALISFIDRDRQWFKAELGFGCRETGLDKSICAKAIDHGGVFVVPDAERDPRVNANPLVYGEPGIRFYAGAPLIMSDKTAIGMVCVLDTRVREAGLTLAQEKVLRDLSQHVMLLLRQRRSS